MRICETKCEDIIPRFMAEDRTVIGMCAVMDFFMQKICEKLPLVNLYENLDLLEEADLDFIAESDEIKWYDTSYTKKQKIQIIQNYEKTCMFLGTKTTIEGIITDIFGMGKEEEWFEYAGEEKTFRIITSALLTEHTNDLVTKIVQYVKTTRSKLDSVQVQRDVNQKTYAGMKAVSVSTPADIYESLKDTNTIKQILHSSSKDGSFTTMPDIYERMKTESLITMDVHSATAEIAISKNNIE